MQISGFPLSLADAFTSKPVSGDDVPGEAARLCREHADGLARAYGITPEWSYDVEADGKGTLADALAGLEAGL